MLAATPPLQPPDPNTPTPTHPHWKPLLMIYTGHYTNAQGNEGTKNQEK